MPHFKQKLTVALVDQIKAFQDSVDVFDTVAAEKLGVNSTDLRCLTILNDRGTLLASDVATALGLTRGATTAALDRLEEMGYVVRNPNVADGRSFLIALSVSGRRKIVAIWAPIRERGKKHLSRYSAVELDTFIKFFRRSIELHEQCTHDLRAE